MVSMLRDRLTVCVSPFSGFSEFRLSVELNAAQRGWPFILCQGLKLSVYPGRPIAS